MGSRLEPTIYIVRPTVVGTQPVASESRVVRSERYGHLFGEVRLEAAPTTRFVDLGGTDYDSLLVGYCSLSSIGWGTTPDTDRQRHLYALFAAAAASGLDPPQG